MRISAKLLRVALLDDDLPTRQNSARPTSMIANDGHVDDVLWNGSRHGSRTRCAGLIAWMALLLRWGCVSLVLPFVVYGQATAPLDTVKKTEPLSFEVASVKRVDPNKPGSDFSSVGPDQNGLRLMSSLEFFIELGFPDDVQIKGLPNWAHSEMYEVAAKTPAPAAPQDVKEMVRTLLAERFKLITHLETKEQAIYSLRVGKGGLKMKPVNADVSYSSGSSRLTGVMNTSQIVYQLTADLRRTVVDNTGLTGRYRVDLRWIPDEQIKVGEDPPSGTSIFTAIQEQLGLKLEPAKGPVRILVIDHVERPSEN
jgi:uncharacterized protein (TIGR03435 family)